MRLIRLVNSKELANALELVKKLRVQIEKNGRNNSRPTSSDGLRKNQT